MFEENGIKILHTADSHLGYRQYQSEIRRLDFFKSFESVIEDAIEMKVDAVIHAGDLFDSRNPSLEDLVGTMEILSKLKKHDIPFLGIVGNHESKQNTQWLDLFSGMKLATRLGYLPYVLKKNETEVAIYGIDNLSNARFQAYDEFELEVYKPKSETEIEPRNKTTIQKNILVLHQLLEPFLPGQQLSLSDFSEKISIPIDLILLGDYHENKVIKLKSEYDSREIWATYSGSTERCSASEEGPRSYNILKINENIQITKRNIKTRPFVIISINYDDEDMKTSSTVLDDVYERISEYSDKIPGSVTFVEITGLKKTLIAYTEIEEHILNLGAVVARVSDKRDVYRENEREETPIPHFQDPDDVVKENLRLMNLTEAGHIMDTIIRDKEIAKSTIDDIADERLTEFVKSLDLSERIQRPERKLEDSVFGDSEITDYIDYIEEENIEEKPRETGNKKQNEAENKKPNEIESKKPKQYTLSEIYGN